ncbi:NAD-dependent epimerase/dehydratase family protein [Paenibacillus oenotherae]|uniref:NAD-dependent epimerase/dehydratase family protein n=1 Tax=Paenibacillus oenotherae TaxID=1435645 RepID=A0ABS7D3L2_9BACL|nr:NAD-dependent epimerase/dehydratase family protein [Paenibacillus oenotherae]MBW7474051.1 NAD-dependent epimerase/dehydratase family protein [Paenibacillus oenotherae]
MRILIIGGTSFIGPYVVKQLVGMGHEVVVYHRGETNADLPESVRHILGARSEMHQFVNEFARFAPDVVIDMIASTEKDAEQLINAFNGVTPRVVAISSQDVYRAYGLVNRKENGALEPVPITEHSPLRQTLYPYQDAAKDGADWCNTYEKIVVERILMGTAAFAVTMVRLPAVYGPGDYQHRFLSYLNLKKLKNNRPYIIMDESFAEWHWTHGYVENVAHAIVTAAVNRSSIGKIYNVGESSAPSMIDFVREIGELLSWKGEIILLPRDTLPDHLRVPLDTTQQLMIDSVKIRAELGYEEIVSRRDALMRTIEWEIRNMPDDRNSDSANPSNDKAEEELLQRLGILT